ncbi:hypothetical protein CMI46_02885 [Candidatus Pacearchaeota archaeon]|nr:hypothetical protein [Candidatus Pacearchaeota archaeon]
MEGTESYPHILVILKNTYFSEWDYRCLSDENLIDQKLKEIRRKKLDLFDLRDDVESFLQERDQSCEVFLQPQPRFTVPLLSHELNPDLILEKDLLDGLYEGRYLFI